MTAPPSTPDGLKLNSGRIYLLKNSTTINADLAHSAVANQSRHKVDGVAPTLTEAEVKSDELTLAYVERLDVASKPATGDFADRPSTARPAASPRLPCPPAK